MCINLGTLATLYVVKLAVYIQSIFLCSVWGLSGASDAEPCVLAGKWTENHFFNYLKNGFIYSSLIDPYNNLLVMWTSDDVF